MPQCSKTKTVKNLRGRDKKPITPLKPITNRIPGLVWPFNQPHFKLLGSVYGNISIPFGPSFLKGCEELT